MQATQAAIQKDRIYLKFPFDKDMIEEVKSIGCRWNKISQTWSIKDSLRTRQLLSSAMPELREQLPIKAPSMNPDYRPNEILMQHQARAVDIARTFPRWLFGHDTGVGKTLEGIEMIRAFNAKTLVVCPLSIIVPAWQEDLDKFAPELQYLNLWKAWKQRKRKNGKRAYEALIEAAQVCIVNFEGFKGQIDYLAKVGFDMLLIDESSKIKSPKADITKDLDAFSDGIPLVYLFSGTPAPNTELEYFSQAKIVDRRVFGTSYYRFRNTYFYSSGFGNFTWLPHPDKRQEFLEKLTRFMDVVRKEDVLDLPGRIDVMREVHLSPAERRAYKDMVAELYIQLTDDSAAFAQTAATALMKLRQIGSGFVFDETGGIHEFGRSRLNVLDELLEEIGNHQVIIWIQFRHEAAQIVKMLTDAGKTVGLCNSTISRGQQEEYVTDFKAGKLQYMVAHPRSLGHGVTLITSHYCIQYSLTWSHEEHTQLRDRIYRKGQNEKCIYYYLVAPGTVDKRLLRCLQQKQNTEKEVFDFIKGYGAAKGKWDEL